jgi:RNA recognition motif-containing protein
MASKLFVGSLSWNATDQMLQDVFSQVGTVVSVAIIKDKYSGKSKGFGFVEMSSEEEAQKAVQELNGKDVDGRAITVSEARPQEPRTNGGGGGGGSRYGSNNRSGGGGYNNDRRGGGGNRY